MADPSILIIFGATGNLAQLKLLPSLYHLEKAKLLDEDLKIVCCGRRDQSQQDWLEYVRQSVEKYSRDNLDTDVFEKFSQRMFYFSGDLAEAETYKNLATHLEQPEYPPNHIFYISMPPSAYGLTIESLGDQGMLKEEGHWRRVVIEKPFGENLESATNLQHRISRHLQEHQTYRIDHYMGKAMVQNILVSRFANSITEPLWNRNVIDHVQIVQTETLGVGSRSNFYDSTGAMRDMLQSHLKQLMALIATEPPVSMDANDMRDEKVKVLKSIRPIHGSAVAAHAFRAQYAAGTIDGVNVPGYRQEPNIENNSVTETYAALKLYVDNWRWRGVPFYLATGKRMAKANSMIAICFKQPPKQFFRSVHMQQPPPNWLIMSMSPEESLRFEITVKEPGLEMNTRQISLDAPFRCEHDAQADAYEGLLLDVIEGESALFLRYDEVEYAWRIIDPIINNWASSRDYIATYPAGQWEPTDVTRIFDKTYHHWRHMLDPET